MFKKTTLALAVSGLLGASAAQAAMVYDQDGTTLDIYGRIAMGFEGGGAEENNVDNSEEFRNFGSRLRITAGHQITSDLRAFARVEWRFTGDERNQASGFDEVRNSYIGLDSEQYGTFTAGNFDSFYDSEVMGVFDVYVERGYEFAGGGLQARGDSLAYMTPDLNGFQAFIAAKHFSERGLEPSDQTSEGNVIATQGGVTYATGPLRLALGYVEDTVRGGGNGETRVGTTAEYAINDAFSARLGYETRGDSDTQGGGFDTVGLGGTFATGAWTFYLDYYNIELDNVSDSRDAWAAAAHYDLSNNFDVFVELNDANEDAVNSYEDDLYYAVGARYHF
ncbi:MULTISPECIES: porin [Halomonadaceae]|uniref:Porin n=1 Tax=Vreelandella piezotolerans TaxID=2609667 RepID=A0ABQ6X8Y8_9GAMM|nr:MULTISPECIES: porin [Halomonas]KAE8438480.1 porin [Halomonas piezotolerans]QJA22836.1 porin [Halomonas piezotolerans]BCB60721.1 porin [Halomonas sp. A020]|tara:strand:- start:243 stop:1250 length:1008 start_codon:yes stop_codon:yes gene_type:complete